MANKLEPIPDEIVQKYLETLRRTMKQHVLKEMRDEKGRFEEWAEKATRAKEETRRKRQLRVEKSKSPEVVTMLGSTTCAGCQETLHDGNTAVVIDGRFFHPGCAFKELPNASA